MYLAVLSKEHEQLPEQEIRSVLESEGGVKGFDRRGDAVVFDSDPFEFKRLAMTQEVSRIVAEFSVGEYDVDISFGGSFAVRCRDLDDRSYDHDEIAAALGERLKQASGNEVDLDEPEVLFRAYLHDGRIFLGEVVHRIHGKEFEDRRSHLRPFDSPVSLHPKLARALVNLAEVKKGDSVLDPFCGTGGILIEAGLIGMELYGLDLDEEMLDGCRENLDAFDLEADLRHGDAISLSDVFNRRFDAVVSDLPYGRASKKDEETDKLVEQFVEEARKVCDGRIVFMVDEPSVAGREADFEIYVHRSLSRFVYILD